MIGPGELETPERRLELSNRLVEALRALRGLPPTWYRGDWPPIPRPIPPPDPVVPLDAQQPPPLRNRVLTP